MQSRTQVPAEEEKSREEMCVFYYGHVRRGSRCTVNLVGTCELTNHHVARPVEMLACSSSVSIPRASLFLVATFADHAVDRRRTHNSPSGHDLSFTRRRAQKTDLPDLLQLIGHWKYL